MKVLLTGGGTAGHINPALAIAQIIRKHEPDSQIEFVGIKGGKEEDLIPREGYPLHFVRSMGIQRRISLANIKAFWLALTSPYSGETVQILDEFQPDAVIGTGGYACWPIMAAAARRKIPTALHESNAYPGLAVRRLQKKVDRIWINFPGTKDNLKVKDKVVRVGNPLRSDFDSLSKKEARQQLGIPEDVFYLVSFGGSLGAEYVNRAVLELMRDLTANRQDLLHLHACGKRDFEAVEKIYTEYGLDKAYNCLLTDYIYDMPLRMAAADLIISRAGAMTLSELAKLRKASVLIPSPYVTDQHQLRNAQALSKQGASRLVEEETLSEGSLTQTVRELLNDRKQIAEMEKAIGAFEEPDVSLRIWKEISELVRLKKQ